MPNVEKPLLEVGEDTSTLDFAAIHFNIRELNALIEEHGFGVVLKKAVYCPCLRIETLQPRNRCPHCKGLGKLYPPSVEICTMALVTGRQPSQDLKAPGFVTVSNASWTFAANVQPGEGDLAFPDDETHVVHEVIAHADNQLGNVEFEEPPGAGMARPTSTRDDRLLYPDVTTIELLMYISPYSGAPDEALVEAVEGTDYTISGDKITWLAGMGPRPGDRYSVRYQAPAAYIVHQSQPRFRSEHSVQTPWVVQMTRYDAWAKENLRTT